MPLTALVLLIGSGLLIASFRNLPASDPGFKSENIITAGVWIPESRYKNGVAVRQFTNRLFQVVQSIPGVTMAGATTNLPLGSNRDDGVVMAEGYEMKPGESVVNPLQIAVTPDYFEAIGTPLLRGRFFDERDNETTPATLIVDERVAEAPAGLVFDPEDLR